MVVLHSIFVGKRRKARSARRDSRPRRADEVFTRGPLTIARFGKNVLWQTHWPEGVFKDTQDKLIAQYPEVVDEIDSLVSEIATLVSELPPDQLLQRAWWEMAMRHTRIETEADVGQDEGTSLRMIDYIQSVIAGVADSPHPRTELTDQAWIELRGKVEQLFQILTLNYQICRSAKQQKEDSDYDAAFDEFEFRAQVYWCAVRGHRYQVHEPQYLRDMFLPHSEVFQRLFGISAEQFVGEIENVWRTLTFGLADLAEALVSFQKDVMDAIEQRIGSLAPRTEKQLQDLAQQAIIENGWENREADIRGRFLGTDLFNLQKITKLPPALLDNLAWEPGQDTDFFAKGNFRGWPLRIWPIFIRPFIRLAGRYYCFDMYSLFDHLYRVMQRLIARLEPSYVNTWNSIQKKTSEDLPFQYFERLLPGASSYRSVHYRGITRSGQVDWCEADGLLVYDDHFFIVEIKGGAFTHTPPASDFPAYLKSLKELVWKPADQGKRFLAYLRTADMVPIFDEHHNKVGELHRADFRKITICAISLDPVTEMAAQVQHLRKVGIDVGTDPVWALSIDDMRVYADIFENPLIFLHFIDQRMQAFQSEVLQLDDELDHVGLYLEHNNYSLHAAEMKADSDVRRVFFHGYRSRIDRFFNARLYDPNALRPLRQSLPPRIREIVEVLSQSDIRGRAEVVSYLLDLSGNARNEISKSIDSELASQPTTKRCRPFSTHGDVKLTVFCWSDSCEHKDSPLAVEHAQTVALVSRDTRRLLLELEYGGAGILATVKWQWVETAVIPPWKLPELRGKAERLRDERVAHQRRLQGKIGRNEPCPCGSGKKFKRCCIVASVPLPSAPTRLK